MAAHVLLSCVMPRLSCGIWDLVPWPGIEPRDLGARNPSHWTTREVPRKFYLRCTFLYSSHLLIVKNWLWDSYVSSKYTHSHALSHIHTRAHTHTYKYTYTFTHALLHAPHRHTTGCYHYPSNRVVRYDRKWRRTKEPPDESEREEWKSWLKAQHSEN